MSSLPSGVRWPLLNMPFYSFGIASFLFEMVPFASLVFAFTNTVGAALWAADMEKQAGTAPNLRQQAEKAE